MLSREDSESALKPVNELKVTNSNGKLYLDLIQGYKVLTKGED